MTPFDFNPLVYSNLVMFLNLLLNNPFHYSRALYFRCQTYISISATCSTHIIFTLTPTFSIPQSITNYEFQYNFCIKSIKNPDQSQLNLTPLALSMILIITTFQLSGFCVPHFSDFNPRFELGHFNLLDKVSFFQFKSHHLL